jgi:hypothetical protein
VLTRPVVLVVPFIGARRQGALRGEVRHLDRELFVIDVEACAADHCVQLHVGVLEEAGHASGQAFSLADDDRVRPQLPLNPRQKLLDRASVVGAHGARALKRG